MHILLPLIYLEGKFRGFFPGPLSQNEEQERMSECARNWNFANELKVEVQFSFQLVHPPMVCSSMHSAFSTFAQTAASSFPLIN